MGFPNIATVIIIVLNVIVSMRGFENAPFFDRYKFNISAILKGKQYDRLITSGFLHVDMMHLVFNMLTLYFFSDALVMYTGYIGYLLIYFGAILGGNLLALWMHKNEYYYNAVGASGGVTGAIFAIIAMQPNVGIGFMLIPGVNIPGWLFGIMYLLYSIYGMRSQLGNIGHDAHLGGAVVGIVLAIVFQPALTLGENIKYLLFLCIPIVILGIIAFREK